jgi:two-component system, NtrC family, sensor kinase
LQDGSQSPCGISRVELVSDVCRKVLRALSLDEALRACARAVVDDCGYDAAGLALLDDDGQHLEPRVFHARAGLPLPPSAPRRADAGLAGRAIAGRRTALRADEPGQISGETLVPGMREHLCVPLLAGQTPIGVLDVHSARPGAFGSEDVHVLETVAGQLALFVDKARSLESATRTRDHFEGLIAHAGEGIVVLDVQGQVTRWNPGMERLLGRAAATAIGHAWEALADEMQAHHAPAAFRRIVEGSPLEQVEDRFTRSEGEPVDVALSLSPVKGSQGGVEGVLVIVRDISGQRRAQKEKEQLQEQLLQTEKLSAIGQLISGVAHELNNPLTGVIAYAQLLSARDCDEPIKRGLETVHAEAKRCHRIVQNLLTFARKHAPSKSLVSINDILESTIELRAYQLRVDNMRVVMDLAPDLPRTMADFHQLQQVFMNLVNNAHQALKEAGRGGTLRLTTRRERHGIRVTIEDDGPGISPENLSRIFDPFFTTKPTGHGTGLGLSICFGIIQEHDGKIAVRSTPERGACFTVDLPVLTDPTVEKAVCAESAPEGAPCSEQARVLVVDDEPSILDVLAEALRSDGHTVDTAVNGRVALRKILEGEYDLVLSDLKMPVMSGQDLFREVARLRPALARRFVFSTGDVMGGDTRDFLQWTGNPYVEKPFHVDKLIGMLRDILSTPS